MPGFITKRPSPQPASKEKKATNTSTAQTFGPQGTENGLSKGTAGTNVVSGITELRRDNETRDASSKIWVKRSRKPIDYLHTN
jgi:hypothetical protein